VLNFGRVANPAARMPNAANAIRDVIVHAMELLRRRLANSTKWLAAARRGGGNVEGVLGRQQGSGPNWSFPTEKHHLSRVLTFDHDKGLRMPTKRKPIHPGVILRENVLPSIDMSVSDVAKALGVSRQLVHRIMAGRTSITPDMALRLGKFCGSGPDLWLRMQIAHDLWHARQALG
jgi:antitoxin HigA-1